MTFGRMNNLRRRAHRPDENFHRDRRRRRITRGQLSSAGSSLRHLIRGLMALIVRK